MNPTCKQCGKREVEDARVCFATPVCFACLPERLAEMAEILEHVRPEDSAPLRLTPKLLLELVGALRESAREREWESLTAERDKLRRFRHVSNGGDLSKEVQLKLVVYLSVIIGTFIGLSPAIIVAYLFIKGWGVYW